MPDTSSPPGRRSIPAERARQGEIVLRTPLRRAVFIAGLAGAVILAAILVVVSWAY